MVADYYYCYYCDGEEDGFELDFECMFESVEYVHVDEKKDRESEENEEGIGVHSIGEEKGGW